MRSVAAKIFNDAVASELTCLAKVDHATSAIDSGLSPACLIRLPSDKT